MIRQQIEEGFDNIAARDRRLAHNPSWQGRARTARSFLDRNDNGIFDHLFPLGDDAAELAAAGRLSLG